MCQVCAGDREILLARVGDKFYATGAHCTHYGAPLAKGILSGDRIVCPWHNACFNVATGEQQEPPALDDLPSFPVRIEGDDVWVEIPEDARDRCLPKMAEYTPKADSRTFVILGAGAAGSVAAETLRQQGFQGRIILLDRAARLPYDRPQLSKQYLQGKASEDALPLRSCEFYQKHNIELCFKQTVVGVDATAQTLTFDNDSTLHYDALLVATGGIPRKLKVSGANLANILTLRQVEDADRIIDAAKGAKRVVAIGSSFISMEAAASLTQRGLAVTVISPEAVPFEKVLGKELGQMFQKLHEKNGVSFRLGTKVTRFEGTDAVEAAILETGERIPCDLALIGIGVRPATKFLQGIKLLQKDGSVPVNEYLQAAAGLYAAGDIARFPDAATGQPTRIEHWRLAEQHGRIAARNMLGQQVKFAGVPFFWTGQFDVKLRYAGRAQAWDEIIFQGNPDDWEFLAFYVRGDRVLAVAGCGRDRDMAAITELMRRQQMPSPDALRERALDWPAQLERHK